MTTPTLQYPKQDGEYQIKTDASDASIGGVLQIKNTSINFLPIAYELRKLTDSEYCYPIVRAQSALDSELVSLEVIKHAAWKPPQSTFQGKIPPFN
ncbi:hypothetical protein DSO57_1003981 [Entomophthora muscae]|uniref:Uncharacterized protein n=1 Tax=Entomophthora muscae TaxID=34485 RepID=A0ACC2TW06_9FUNG|nr:hypothetical protein DSO57_1003981 [Entomophthora muscae]